MRVYMWIVHPEGYVREIFYESLPRWLYRIIFVYHLSKIGNLISVFMGYSTLTPRSKNLEDRSRRFLIGTIRPYEHFVDLQMKGSFTSLESNKGEDRRRSDAEIECWVNEQLGHFSLRDRKKFMKAAKKERDKTFGK